MTNTNNLDLATQPERTNESKLNGVVNHTDTIKPCLKTTNETKIAGRNSNYITITENDTLLVQKPTIPPKDSQDLIYIKHKKYHKNQGIAGILSKPDHLNDQKKAMLLLHGHTGHKNNLHFPMIDAHLHKAGYYVLRIDFRGLGDSEDSFDPELGRTIQQDLQDIETCYLFFNTILKVQLNTVMAHSRAVMSMFEFQLKVLQSEKYTDFVPNLINCSGRYDSMGLQTKIMSHYPNWIKDKGYTCTAPRYGTRSEIFIPIKESQSAINVNTASFANIDPRCFVLSIYGAKEDIMPLSAATKFAKLFKNRHRLEFVDYADHNYFGLPNDPNPLGLPLRNGKVNYNSLVADLVTNFLSPQEQLLTFNETNSLIFLKKLDLYKNRWPLPYKFSKVLNFRDCGGYLTENGTSMVKPGIFYRSANLVDLSPMGVQCMDKMLHVKQIFDLRSEHECEKWGIVDCKNYSNWKLLSFKRDLDPEEIIKNFKNMTLGGQYFPQCYLQTLYSSLPAIKKFFQYLLANDVNEFDHAVVFHCAVGKDRTGILSMILLKILGVDDYTICMDYTLTRLGLDLQVSKIDNKFIECIMSRDYEFYIHAMGQEQYDNLVENFDMTPLKMNHNIMSCEFVAMKLFLDLFESTFASVENFFTKNLEFTAEDIQKLKTKYLL
ncbi:hypothetical protein ACO0RG_002020 [Hanseniaspora osmophila]